MEWKKNDEIIITIDDLGKDGEGIGHVDGYALFVKDALPGETVRIKIMKIRKGFGFARLIQIIVPSKERVEPPCLVARQCGGCQLQHLSYPGQLKYKQKKVTDCLTRIGGINLDNVEVSPIIGAKDPWHYRNKAQFPVREGKDGEPVVGFYASRTHSVIPVTDCMIQNKSMKKILEIILDIMKVNQIPAYNEEEHTGIVRHIFIRKGAATGDIMVCLVINDSFKGFQAKLAPYFVEALSELKGVISILCNINREQTNIIMGERTEVLWGKQYIEDKIGKVKYAISAQSFYQVNPAQTIHLYEKALEFAALEPGQKVWDLYCGIGTISLFLAQQVGENGHVCGIEVVKQAVLDARKNATRNKMPQVDFICGQVEDVIDVSQKEQVDVVVVDPPRKGCEASLLEAIGVIAPKRVVYVSCDPATLARDCKALKEFGYEVSRVQAVDMFPQGGHVETVVLLSQQKPSDRIAVDLDLDELDATSAEMKATYAEIKNYVLKEHGLKVSNLYISQVKRKCGLEVGENYNLAKLEDAKQPNCPEEKEKAIVDALKYFGMVIKIH